MRDKWRMAVVGLKVSWGCGSSEEEPEGGVSKLPSHTS